ncbi:uncharacterized protein KNAG_0J01580 [Huiozyma naganishii CBS 8797]|uniref:Uncharacterized protein n=1 Tax=Huiozyma naganishii (strain ATCC MYA-139 / BCRC 22969 / CBS 8797 / KCTC 17520 / NBRC 10181 / NCYC 3082 / Yp74L-3) TaxID=1071383 RepID=J7S9Q5_HUIN7|nr:hypothetical protein KNAG_0J01580 [Kazachstania naganishii CBS 8797]CCK72239.1 hypothetical protein KNAG_0J01580 [Kazachstania naganishii CBS 8797]
MSAEVAPSTASSDTVELDQANIILNEEFKIWKKTIPSLYKHISTFKPAISQGSAVLEDEKELKRAIVFTDKLVPDKNNGTLSTSVLCSQGSNIYTFETFLPLGVHYTSGANALTSCQYNEHTIEQAIEFGERSQHWVWQNETVNKLFYVGDEDVKFIALAESGALGWFKDGLKPPQKVLCGSEMQGSDVRASVDADVSSDGTLIVKCLPMKDTLTLVGNTRENRGNLVRSIAVDNASTIRCIKFIGSDIFACCSRDNLVRFYSSKSNNQEPVWLLRIPDSNGTIECIGSSLLMPTLVAFGTSNGTIKIWDTRSIRATSGLAVNENPLLRLNHLQQEGVVDIQFSAVSPTQFITVGSKGNVYHWDLEYLMGKGDDDSEIEAINQADLQEECLAFYHTGGCRRSIGTLSKKNTAQLHSTIGELVVTVDADGLVTVYIPFNGRYETEIKEDEALQKENDTPQDEASKSENV